MRTRVGISGKGISVALLGTVALLSGTGLQVPLLNLCGYFCWITLAMALLLAFLELRGVALQAVAGWPEKAAGARQVWVRAPSSRRAGPFGLALRAGKAWALDVPVFVPDVAGLRLTQAVEAAGRPRVRLRSFPLGLVWVSREAIADLMSEPDAPLEREPRPVAGPALHEPFGGIREHRPGESMRDVHWGVSARLGRLVVRLREPSPEPVPQPRAPRPFERAPIVRSRMLMHLATAGTGAGAIAFSWAIGTVPTFMALAAFVVHGLGCWVSARRSGRPGLLLSIVLYVAMLAALGWFAMSARHWQTAAGSAAILLAAVAAIFAWDLRNRQYLRAQQLNAFVLMGFTSAIVQTRDTPMLGVLFALTAGALLLAFWADGRQAIGTPTVSLKDLETLPGAWLPIGLMGLIALLAHPWIPALPMPPLPTFGISFSSATAGRPSAGSLPGQEGMMSLDARWEFDPTPVLWVEGAFLGRLRAEVFQSYRAGYWFRCDRAKTDWLSPSPSGRSAIITLQRVGMSLLPVPEGTVRVLGQAPKRTRYQAGVIETHFPARRDFLYRAIYVAPERAGLEPPTAAELSTTSLDPRFYALARIYSRGASTPQGMLERIVATLRARKAYDLEAPQAPLGYEPTLYFLESSPSGFCVHFATAMVLMARELGIPARLVTGYAQGNIESRRTQFRASDAHAWVEAFVGGHWQAFDPTPVNRGPSLKRNDGIRLSILGVLAVAIVGYALWRRPRRNPATRRYLALLRHLRRRGLIVTPASSPAAVMAWAEGALSAEEREALEAAIASYQAERFGAPS